MARSQASTARIANTDSKLTEASFQLAFENSPIGMAIVDFDYRLRRVNRALCAALGYKVNELLRRNFVDITHPDDIGEDVELADKLFRGEIPSYRLQKRFVTKQGSLAWLDMTAMLVRNEKGEPVYGLAMVEDLTDRRRSEEALMRSEEQYRSFIVNSSEGIWRLEIEQPIDITLPAGTQVKLLYKYGYLAECNDALARMYGRSRAEDIIGSRFGDLTEISHPATRASLYELVRNNYRLRDWPIDIVARGDGAKRYLSTSLLGIVLNGMLMRVWSVQKDQTEQQRVANRLSESHQRLRSLSAYLQSVREKERSDLARELHDHLGQSLTSIKLSLAGLQRTVGDNHGANEVAQRFSEINEVLAETIRSVKSISTELRPGVLDKFGLAAAVEWQCGEFSRRSRIMCDVHVPSSKIIVEPDIATALFRILQEALTNIARHAGATKVEVVLKVSKSGASLTVADNGKGISAEKIDAPDSLGLLGMRERAETIGGEFSITASGKGTQLIARAVRKRKKQRDK